MTIEEHKATYTVVLDSEPTGNVSVTVTSDAPGTALVNKDSGSPTASTTLIFQPSGWDTPQTVTVSGVSDDLDNPGGERTATIAHTVSGGDYGSVSADPVAVTVTDDDDDITVSVDDAEGEEGEQVLSRIFLSKPAPHPVEVGWGTHPGTAKACAHEPGTEPPCSGDFEERSVRVRFEPGEVEKFEPVWLSDDDIAEPNEIFFFVLHNPVGAVLADPVTETPSALHPDVIVKSAEAEWATVTIRGVDHPPVEVTLQAVNPAVGEGASMKVIATLAEPLPWTVRIPLVYSDGTAEPGDYEGATGLSIFAGHSSGSALIEMAQDADEDDEAFTVSFGELPPLVLAGASTSVEATILDDDSSSSDFAGLTVSVYDAEAREGKDDLEFEVRLNRPAPGPVSVQTRVLEGTATAAIDYVFSFTVVRFNEGERSKTVYVTIRDDSIDEGSETLTLELHNPDPVEVTLARARATGTIVNHDPMPAAWLGRFGRTAAQQALDGVAERIAAPRTPGFEGTIAGWPMGGHGVHGNIGSGDVHGSPGDSEDGSARNKAGFGPDRAPTGMRGQVGSPHPGEPPVFGTGSAYCGADHAMAFPAEVQMELIDQAAAGVGHNASPGTPHGGPADCPRSLSLPQWLTGSAFASTGRPDAGGGTWARWGRGALSGFSGREGTLDLTGEVATAMLGIDYARERVLAGFSLTHSVGRGRYTGYEAGGGRIEAELTAAVPYIAWHPSGRTDLWAAAGVGTGKMTLDQGASARTSAETLYPLGVNPVAASRTGTDPEARSAVAATIAADISWRLAAAGLRGDLIGDNGTGGAVLAFVSDALWTQTSSDQAAGLSASDSDVTRLRAGLEGSWTFHFESGNALTPKLAIGARHDGGDAETGFGVELGGGITWVDPRLGLSLDVEGRTLIAHEDGDLKDRGISASLAFDSNPATERGPSFSLRRDFGSRANGGLDALFAPDPLADRTGSDDASRWAMEAAYGFPAFGKRFTGSPHVGLGMSNTARDYSLGWRLTPVANAPALSFGVKAALRESDTAVPEHRIGIEAVARW